MTPPVEIFPTLTGKVAADHANVWATVGLHPHDAVNGVDVPESDGAGLSKKN
jgi:hypothetical protein